MLSTTECMQILSDQQVRLENILTLHCTSNRVVVEPTGKTFRVNESQKRLLMCLSRGINCKRKIINVVWYENHQKINDNNYHQLVFQCRALFKREGLPADLLVTIHYHGLMFNEILLRAHATTLAPQAVVVPETTPSTSWLSRLLIRVNSQ